MNWWNEPDPIRLVSAHAELLVADGWDCWKAVRFAARLWQKVDRVLDDDEACWLWTSATYKDGRAIITVEPKQPPRIVSRIVLGAVDRHPRADELACHTCDRPMCVRPEHLWWGSVLENNRDKISKGRDTGRAGVNRLKTVCDHGHLLSGENLGVNNRGQRYCKECARRAARRAYDKKYRKKTDRPLRRTAPR